LGWWFGVGGKASFFGIIFLYPYFMKMKNANINIYNSNNNFETP